MTREKSAEINQLQVRQGEGAEKTPVANKCKVAEKFRTGYGEEEMNKTFAEAFKGNWGICGVRNNRVDCEYKVVKKN